MVPRVAAPEWMPESPKYEFCCHIRVFSLAGGVGGMVLCDFFLQWPVCFETKSLFMTFSIV
jgi:hypothetical protein